MTAGAPDSTSTDQPAATPVGLVFGSLAVGVLAGIGVTSVVSFIVRTLHITNPPAPATDPQSAIASALASGPTKVLFLGVLAACLTAAILTWRLTAPIRDLFRQGVLAIMAAFGTFVAGFITTIAADQAAAALSPPAPDALPSRAGFVVLAVAALAAAAGVARRLRSRAVSP